MRATAFQLLSDLGYNVRQSSNGETAINILKSGARIDLLFTDVIMPGKVTGHALAEQAQTPGGKVPPKENLTVLVCEDDVLIRMNVAECLEEAGYKVLEAGTAKATRAFLKAEPVQLLLTDVGLPDSSGEDLVRAARDHLPDVPIILATGGDISNPLGNTHLLRKPFNDTELRRLVERVLSPS